MPKRYAREFRRDIANAWSPANGSAESRARPASPQRSFIGGGTSTAGLRAGALEPGVGCRHPRIIGNPGRTLYPSGQSDTCRGGAGYGSPRSPVWRRL